MTLQKVRIVECARNHTEHVGRTGLIETLAIMPGEEIFVSLDPTDEDVPDVVCAASLVEQVNE